MSGSYVVCLPVKGSCTHTEAEIPFTSTRGLISARLRANSMVVHHQEIRIRGSKIGCSGVLRVRARVRVVR